MNITDIIIIVISIVLGLIASFILLPLVFDQIKKLMYLKLNSGSNSEFTVNRHMFYNSNTGKLEEDQIAIH